MTSAQRTPISDRFRVIFDRELEVTGYHIYSGRVHVAECDAIKFAEMIVAKCNAYDELLAALTAAFMAMGRTGANADVNHPLRKDWEAARAAIARAEAGS